MAVATLRIPGGYLSHDRFFESLDLLFVAPLLLRSVSFISFSCLESLKSWIFCCCTSATVRILFIFLMIESLKSWIFCCCTSATVRIFHIFLMKNLWNLGSFVCCTSATTVRIFHIFLMIKIFEILDLLLLHLCYIRSVSFISFS